MYPSDASDAEAHCLELLAWSSNTVHVAYALLLRPERFVLSEANHPAVNESGGVNYRRCLADIDVKLQRQEHAVGSQFSVVDPFWLVFYRWGVRLGYDMNSAYVEQLCRRPSIQRTLAAEAISVWS